MTENQHNIAITSAVKRFLLPLVRLLIANGLTFPIIVDLLKRVYVEVAARFFLLPDKKQTDSRIHLLTGVHRKDVRQFREEQITGLSSASKSSTMGALLVSRWTGDPRYLDASGHPRPLPKSGDVSFNSLVEGVSTNIRPRAVLDEWLRLGVGFEDENGMVHLNMAAFIPEQGFEEKCFFLGENVRAHMEACVNNLLQEGPPELERNVFYDKLSKESVAELKEMAASEGMRILQVLNRRAFDLQQRDAGAAGADRQMRFGFYWHEEKGEDNE